MVAKEIQWTATSAETQREREKKNKKQHTKRTRINPRQEADVSNGQRNECE